MINREDLPEDAADWTSVSVWFPRLANDCPADCPYTEAEVFDYICKESADLDLAERDRLHFIRTAEIDEVRYWLWEYYESDLEVCSVYVCERPDRSTRMGLSLPNGLSHEQ